MSQLFKVALLQYPIAWADKETNLREATKRIVTLAGKADMALLPEMFSTGFCTDRPELAESMDGETMKTLQAVANQYDIAIAGSFICRDDEGLKNRGFLVRPHATVQVQDKRHLYAHGGEDRFFTAGQARQVFEYKGVRMQMLVCYDLRFPAWARNHSGNDYDILLVCANWPEIRIQYWDALVAARAIENQCYIAAVNPVGDDALGLHYNGHSVAYDTRLQAIAQFDDDEEGVRIAEFDIDALHHFREALPLWKDVDAFEIHTEGEK